MNFDQAFEDLIGHEGGYVNNPKDPGGETKFGISKRRYPQENIPMMTLERSKMLYKRDFWGVSDTLPPLVRFLYFDMSVNMGPEQTAKYLQRAAGMDKAQVDGQIGPKSLLHINAMEVNRLYRRFMSRILRHYTGLNHTWWSEFGRGVINRAATNLEKA